jgi:hypothetical protein
MGCDIWILHAPMLANLWADVPDLSARQLGRLLLMTRAASCWCSITAWPERPDSEGMLLMLGMIPLVGATLYDSDHDRRMLARASTWAQLAVWATLAGAVDNFATVHTAVVLSVAWVCATNGYAALHQTLGVAAIMTTAGCAPTWVADPLVRTAATPLAAWAAVGLWGAQI